MTSFRYVICDVFTDRALTGNPLAVFTDARGLNGETMQALARELNLSETTFVLPAEQGGDARVRIFTPTKELPFAGHPTLGTAWVLGGSLAQDVIRLELGVGTVPVRLERDGDRLCFGWMTQPAVSIHPEPAITDILHALDLQDSVLPVERYVNGPEHVLITLDSAQAIRRVTPNFAALAEVAKFGVALLHPGPGRCEVRYFAPAAGVNEDPATGSAAGPVALHLVRHGKLEIGQPLSIEQGAGLHRPSQLTAKISGSLQQPIVEVGGSAVVVAEGEFRLPA